MKYATFRGVVTLIHSELVKLHLQSPLFKGERHLPYIMNMQSSLPSVSAVEVIKTEPCVCMSVCVVHHQPVLCSIVHKGNLAPSDVGFAPDILHMSEVYA